MIMFRSLNRDKDSKRDRCLWSVHLCAGSQTYLPSQVVIKWLKLRETESNVNTLEDFISPL